ncbi:MATE family efflux transporter [Dasania marina]|uniref:MATE family efflux transporter n=1 Tax=Dasania marina TaxID=471499 RepID=UPI0030DC3F70|tara:strand:+ start:37818 stop:39146 length:1329 start_codon:yes stop_codon:yes gene_type:complete
MPYNKTLNHKIWALAWPIIISNLSIPLLGLVDTAILGHLDSAHYLAAVAVGSSVLTFLYWGFGFLRMGTTGFAAQAYGTKNHQASRQLAAQSLLMGAVIGIALLLTSPWLLQLGLSLIEAPANAQALALSYTQIRIFSAPAVLINYAIIGWLIGHQNTRWPLLIMLLTNASNILLDLWFVIGLKLNSDGAAWATLIAEYLGCGLALYALKRQLGPMSGALQWPPLLQWHNYHALLKVNRHLFVRTLALLASFAFFTAQGAQQGEIILAANAILMQLVMLSSYGMDGFAHASEALVGDAVGRRNHRQFIASCRGCAFWAALSALLFSLAFYLLGEHLLPLFSNIDAVVHSAKQYFPWVIALPLLAVASYCLDGIFIGASQSQAMQYSMLFSCFLVYIPCWYFSQHWGNHGLWFAFAAFNLTRGISLGYYFYRYNKQRYWYPAH